MTLDRAGNSLSQARAIGTLSGSKSFRDAVSSQDRNDFYKFRLASRSNFSLVLKDLRANADVRLLDKQGQVIEASTRLGTQSESIRKTLGAGVYYIRVYQKSGDTSYTLNTTAAAVPVRPAIDPGSTLGTAFNTGVLNGLKIYKEFVSTSDRTDIYKFSLDRVSNFSTVINGLTDNAQIRLIFDANQNGIADYNEQIASNYANSSYNGIISKTLGAGTYYVEVKSSYSTSNTSYNLSLSAVSVSGITPTTDPGSTLDTSFNTGLLSGSKSFKQFVGTFDRLDVYRFTLDRVRTFNATINGLSDGAQIRLVCDANQNGIADYNEEIAYGYANSSYNGIISKTLGAGTYYVEVKSSYSTSNTSYNLSLSAASISGITPTTDPGSTLDTSFNTGLLSGSKSFKQFVGTFDRVDVYRFTLDEVRTLNANLSGLSDGTQIRLIYDVNQNGIADYNEQIAYGYANSSYSEIISKTLGAGTYYIEVSSSHSTSNTSYNLNLSAASISGITPTTDPGSTLGTSFNTGLLSGSKSFKQFVGTTDRVDVYRFTLAGVRTLNANLSGLSDGTQIRLIYDVNQNGIADYDEQIASNYADSSYNGIISKTLGAGTYYIEVSSSYSTSNTSYNLNLSAVSVSGITPTTDPGSTLGTSFNTGLLSGSKSFKQFVGTVDRVDVYRFTLDEVRTFNANLSGLSDGTQIRLIYDANQNGIADYSEQIAYDYADSSYNGIISKTLGAGTYYIEVSSSYSTNNTSYNLTMAA